VRKPVPPFTTSTLQQEVQFASCGSRPATQMAHGPRGSEAGLHHLACAPTRCTSSDQAITAAARIAVAE